MGVILDSSVLISAERKGKTVPEILEQLRQTHGDVDLGVSVVTIAELVHGAQRAQNDLRRQRRLSFIDELCASIPVYPVTVEIAKLAGQMQGQLEAQGVRCGFEDLFIGITALSLGFSLSTFNLRHFQSVPGLQVRQP